MSLSKMSSSDANQKRECIFLDSSDPSMPNQILLHDSTSLSFNLPFPPCIDPYKLILDRKQDIGIDHIPTRIPNAFLLYRKIFVESAHKAGYRLPMTVISSMASRSWKRESDTVKKEYKRISKQALEIRNQLFPKFERKRKREKWNLVSFSKKSNSIDNSIKIEMKTSGNQLNHENEIIQQKGLDENFNSFNPNLEIFSSELSSSDVNESTSYIKPNLNYQMYNQIQKSENLMHNSYNSHENNNGLGMYIDTTNQHHITSTNIESMEDSHSNFQSYYM